MVSNKTKFVLLAIAAITSLLMFTVFQAYAAPSQQKVPTLVVFVHVINDEGGTMVASDFAVTVTAKDPSPSIFRGSETGTTVTMKNSEYKVTELEVKGYKVSYSPGCSGRINNNEAKTCVVTNDDIAPHLKVIKHVINDNGSIANASDFTIFVYGNNPTPSSFSGSEVGTDVKIGPGYYNVNEYWNPEYYSSYSPECNGEIKLGENKTCIITNNDIPKGHLMVIKHVINDNSGTANASDFTMIVNGNNPSPSSFQGSEMGTNVTIYEGYYNVWEYSRSDYSQSYSTDCSGYISGGETKTCTITNDDIQPAHLIVIKHVINDNGGAMNASNFTMYVNGNYPTPSMFQGSEAGIDVTIYPGWYNVYENYYPQYNSFSSGDCYAYINSGETRTCTITNDDIY
ncbi:MAG: hypothetical protein EPN24_06005 [Candidatus Methanoperedens sp.]|nr:MAG: hypothetical protein EPN24_06005 [Candidatus Methanoperedens sp.]